MPILKFTGYSDGCFTCTLIDANPGLSELICNDGNNTTMLFEVQSITGKGCYVLAYYLGVWIIGIMPLDEDIPIPFTDWSISFGAQEVSYSPALYIDTGGDSVIVTEV